MQVLAENSADQPADSRFVRLLQILKLLLTVVLLAISVLKALQGLPLPSL